MIIQLIGLPKTGLGYWFFLTKNTVQFGVGQKWERLAIEILFTFNNNSKML